MQNHNTVIDCEFESCTCHNRNTNREEGNWKPLHTVHFTRKSSEPVSGFCYAGIRVCDTAFLLAIIPHVVFKKSPFLTILNVTSGAHLGILNKPQIEIVLRFVSWSNRQQFVCVAASKSTLRKRLPVMR